MLACDRLAAAWASRRNRSTKDGSDESSGNNTLMRDGPYEEQVLGQVDLGHAAPGDVAYQLVALAEDLR